MKFEFNSNTVMAVIMFITLLGGGYSYIESQIKAVNDKVEALEIPGAYNDNDIRLRLSKIEEAKLDNKVDLILQKVDSIQTYDPTMLETTVNEIKIDLTKLKADFENLKERGVSN